MPASSPTRSPHPELYEAFDSLPNLGTPRVLSCDRSDGRVTMRVRYRFTGDVSSAVKRVVDPDKLSWVDVSEHDLVARTVTTRLEPDHYPDRLRCSGRSAYVDDSAGSVRSIEMDLGVRVRLFGALVENAIASGMREHLDDEVAVVERFIRDRQ